MKNKTDTINFSYERTLKIRSPKFTLFKNVRYLDPQKLERGSHTIEVGRFDDCGCDCTVRAKIKDGMITGILHERCKNARPIQKEVASKMLAAYKKLTKNVRRDWQDIPVKDVIKNPTVAARLKDIIVHDDCFMICYDAPAGEACIICCFEKDTHWCIINDILY